MKTIVVASLLAFTLGAPAALPAAAQTAKKEPTAKQLAARERQTKCSAEWKQAKEAKTLAPGSKWPQFWSACNKRLKGASV